VFYFGLTVMVAFLNKPAGVLSEPGH
jgi:hypothetical protein